MCSFCFEVLMFCVTAEEMQLEQGIIILESERPVRIYDDVGYINRERYNEVSVGGGTVCAYKRTKKRRSFHDDDVITQGISNLCSSPGRKCNVIIL